MTIIAPNTKITPEYIDKKYNFYVVEKMPMNLLIHSKIFLLKVQKYMNIDVINSGNI
ncbi:hypothetical protein CAL7102_06026 [Dulcicalothrix desertica PCC 7102]|nr:hypothetical protein CAL7102_06026 [Dulcicalothrix desertica PCC 7102]